MKIDESLMSKLMELPNEIYINIFEQLDIISLIRLSSVCRKYHHIVHHIISNNYIRLNMTVMYPHSKDVEEKYKHLFEGSNFVPSLWMVLNGSHSVPRSLLFVKQIPITYSTYWITIRDFIDERVTKGHAILNFVQISLVSIPLTKS